MRITERTQRIITVEWEADEADRFLLAFDRVLQGGNGDSVPVEQERKDHDILTSFYNDLSEAVGEL